MILRLQAFGELFSRYAMAFRHAWQHRAAMEPAPRLPHEAQFLPAALSLQETPVSPVPRLSMWMLIAFASLAFLWSMIGQVDVVATAQGKVVPNGRTKTIQPFETSSVKAIHVADGQEVKAGQVLIDLDATTAQADKERLSNELMGVRLQVARSQALLAALEKSQPAVLLRPEGVEEPQFQEAQRVLAGQMGEYTAKQNRIGAEIAKREAERRSVQEQVGKLERTLPIARQRAEDFKKLLDQDVVSKHAYLEREQVHIEQEAELSSQRSRIREIEAALREARGQREEILAETRRIHLENVMEGQQKRISLEKELLKAAQRDRLMQLTAPVEGTVQQLAVHTVGGIVTPAQPVMVIVPRSDAVEVEAFIENKDIGFIQVGQEAEVKIETFQYTKYGTIHALVDSVSHDAINDEKRGLIYSSRIKLSRTNLEVNGRLVDLTPGMAVSVEVRINKRRVIDYFLSPLIQYAKESLREP
ncbi:MAG: HlyD family type I secretion periplasmic adaptor subunit [Magnetococcales bacterium]|nr:HlyD family type I secretion periplasmic adaptor subunit [Magnetococcales bacterium]